MASRARFSEKRACRGARFVKKRACGNLFRKSLKNLRFRRVFSENAVKRGYDLNTDDARFFSGGVYNTPQKNAPSVAGFGGLKNV